MIYEQQVKNWIIDKFNHRNQDISFTFASILKLTFDL